MKHDEIPERNATIVACLGRGDSVEDVAARFDLKPRTVDKIGRDSGWRPTPKPRTGEQAKGFDAKPERSADMVARASAGETFVDIGALYGVSRERVRQIVLSRGGGAASQYAAARESAKVQALSERVNDYARTHPDTPASHIDKVLGIDSGTARRVLGETEAMRRTAPRTYSSVPDKTIFEAMRAVAALPGGTPLSTKFWDAHRDKDATVTAMRLLQRFETWTGACRAAGVEPAKAVRSNYERTWDRDTLIDWVVTFLDHAESQGVPSTWRNLSEWSKQTPQAPSGSTIRLYCGPWIPARREALARRAESARSSQAARSAQHRLTD